MAKYSVDYDNNDWRNIPWGRRDISGCSAGVLHPPPPWVRCARTPGLESPKSESTGFHREAEASPSCQGCKEPWRSCTATHRRRWSVEPNAFTYRHATAFDMKSGMVMEPYLSRILPQKPAQLRVLLPQLQYVPGRRSLCRHCPLREPDLAIPAAHECFAIDDIPLSTVPFPVDQADCISTMHERKATTAASITTCRSRFRRAWLRKKRMACVLTRG